MGKNAGCKTTSVLICLIGLLTGLLFTTSAWGATYFTDDAEDLPQWTGDAPWATTTAAFHSGSKAWADSPDGYYANDSNVSLALSESISLTPAVSPRLVFWHQHQIESGFDF